MLTKQSSSGLALLQLQPELRFGFRDLQICSLGDVFPKQAFDFEAKAKKSPRYLEADKKEKAK